MNELFVFCSIQSHCWCFSPTIVRVAGEKHAATAKQNQQVYPTAK